MELQEYGIGVHEFVPGLAKTVMTQNGEMRPGEWIKEAEDVVRWRCFWPACLPWAPPPGAPA